MESNSDKYVLLPYGGQQISAAASLGWELYYGEKRLKDREKALKVQILPVSTLSKWFNDLAIVPHDKFIEKHNVRMSGSLSLAIESHVQ